jgi:GT2 family glycosyltransferase
MALSDRIVAVSKDGTDVTTAAGRTRPRASLVIVNWNTRDLILQCVASVKSAEPTLPLKIIVVDNASSDGSADAIAAHHPDVCLVRSGENLGFAKGNNLGFRHADGEYIVLLNSDTIVLPGAISRLLRYLDDHADVGLAGGHQLDAQGRFAPSGSRFPSIWIDLSVVVGLHRLRYWFLDNQLPVTRLWFETRTGDVDWVSGSFAAVRRCILDEVSALPEEFFMYGEDVEWCWRIRHAGWRIAYVHGTPIIHLENRSTDKLFKTEKPHRLLDGFFTFAYRHRNPVGWRVSWMALASYWLLMSVRFSAKAALGNPDGGERARI